SLSLKDWDESESIVITSSKGSITVSITGDGSATVFDIANDTNAAYFQGITSFTITENTSGETSNGYALTFDNIALTNITAAGPTISGATYDASTNQLVVTGSGMTTGDTISVDKLTLTGQGGSTYTLTSSDVTASSATQFTVTLSATDQLFVEGLLNNNGTQAADASTFNLAAADDWDSNVTSGDTSVTTVGITVSNTQSPTISSTGTTYDASTGVLTVTGTNMVHQPGASNDIDPTKLTITGQGGGTRTLTASAVEITSATSFTITLTGADKTAVDSLLNANGTQSSGSTTYNITATDDWNGPIFGNTADLTGNGITVSGVVTATAPSYSSAVGYIGESTFTITFDSPLDASSVPTLARFGSSVDVNGTGVSVTGATISGNSVTLTIQATLLPGDIIDFTYSDPVGDDASGVLQGASGGLDVASFSHSLVVATARPEPTLQSATVEGATLVLTYDQTLDATNIPATSDFAVSVGGNPVSVTNVTVNSANMTVTLTLAEAAQTGQTVTVSYTDPTAGNDTNAIQNTGGDDAASFSGQSVTNNTVSAPPTLDLNGADAGTDNTVELSGTITLAPSATAADTENDSGNWNSGSLTVQRFTGGSADATADDTFSFTNTGTFTDAGGSLTINSGATTFATYTNSGGVLTISFNSNATTALVQEVIQNITYSNDTPAGDATIRFSLSDGSSATTADVTVTSDTIYVTSATDTSVIDISNGVSLSEAVAIAAADTTGTQTIVFDSSLAGQTLTLAGSLAISESLTFDMDNASGMSITGSTITVASGATLTLSNGSGDSASIASSISGSGDLTKDGEGALTLSGANTYTGSTTLSAGTLTLSGGSAIGDNSAVNVTGGTLVLAASEIINTLTSTGGTLTQAGFTLTASGTTLDASGMDRSSGDTGTLTTNNSSGVTIKGTRGDDIIIGGSGSDTLEGGDGNDTLTGGAGSSTVDTLIGGNGDDTFVYTSSSLLTNGGNSFIDSIDGGAGTDTLRFEPTSTFTFGSGLDWSSRISGIEKLSTNANSSTFNMTFRANAYSEGLREIDFSDDTNSSGTNNIILSNITGGGMVVTGTAGSDLIRGGSGADTLSGGSGNDTIEGNAGDDIISGGAGTDSLSGGSGNDTFVGAASELNGDTITDFSSGDGIQLTGVSGLTAANVRINGSTLEIDTDSTTFASPEVIITLTSVPTSSIVVTTTNGGADTLITLNSAPSFSSLNGGATYTEDGTAVVIDSDVTVADTELDALNSVQGNYNGASVTISRSGGANTDDQFGNSGLLGSLTEGESFTYNGTTVGTVTANSAGVLTLTFNANATSAIADGVLQAITYANSSQDPSTSVTLSWTFNDGSTDSTGTNQAVISITPVNDAPTDISLSNTTASAYWGSGVTVGALSATDVDSSSWTFTLVSGSGDTDNASFDIFSGTVLTINDPGSMAAGSYSIRVRADDGASGTYEEVFTITVSDELVVTTNLDSSDDATVSSFVADSADGGGLSLREALYYASNRINSTGGTVTIGFASGLNGQTITLGSNASVADGVIFDADDVGTLTISGNELVLAGELTLSNASADSLTINSALSDDGLASSSLITSGAGTVTLTGANNTADTGLNTITVEGGTLSIAADTNLGTGLVTLNGGTLQNTAATTIDNDLVLGSAGGTITLTTLSATTTLSGQISGDGSLALNGASNGSSYSTLNISGDNSYTGVTTLSSGVFVANSSSALGDSSAGTTVAIGSTLQIGGAYSISESLTLSGSGISSFGALYYNTAAISTLSGAISLAADTTINSASGAGTLRLNGVISGSGSLTKTGSGLMTLSGDNDYTGATIVSAGYLIAASNNALGATGSSSATTVASGATLRVSSDVTIAENLTVSGSGSSSNGALQGTGGTATIAGTVTLNSDIRVTVSSGNLVISGAVDGIGGITKASAGTLTLSGSNSYSGITYVQAGTLSITDDSNLGSGSVYLNGTTLVMTGTDSTIDNAFYITGTGNTLTNTNSITLSGVISGSGSLTKNGAGILTLSGSNSYAGTTSVDAGTLSIAADSNLGAGALTLNGSTLNVTGSGVTIDNAVALTSNGGTLSNANAVTLSGVISGDGDLSKTNSGILTLSNTNTYTGATTVLAGALSITDDSNLGSGAVTLNGSTLTVTGSAVTIDNAIALTSNGGTISNANDVALSGVISGDGDLSKTDSGVLTLSNTNTYTGATSVLAGSLSVAGDDNLGTGTLTLNGGTLTVTGSSVTIDNSINLGINSGYISNANALTLSGAITGDGDLGLYGAGTLTLSGNNSYAGSTIINDGTLSVAQDGNLGTGALTLNGGTLVLTGGDTIDNDIEIDIDGAVVDVLNTDATLSGTISGNGTLTKTNSSTTRSLTLSGDNSSFAGGITVTKGNLVAANAAALGSGTISLTGGNLQATGSYALTNSLYLANTSGSKTSTINVATGETLTLSGTINVADAAQNLGKSGNGVLALSGTTGFNGAQLVVNQGSLSLAASGSLGVNAQLYVAGGTGEVTLTGSGTFSNSILLGKDLTLTNDQDVTLSGVISTSSGTTNVTKNGAGTLTFSGVNTYTGTTTISAGTLYLTGGSSIADTSAVTVSSGATLFIDYNGEVIGSLAGSGTVTLNGGMLYIGEDNTSTTFSGTIEDYVNTGSIGKIGTGTLTLSGSNSYGGITSVVAGTLSITDDSNLGSGTVYLNRTTLIITGADSTIDNALSINGTGSTIDNANSITLSGSIAGTGSLIKTGAGTLTLTGDSTYPDTTTVSAGTLSVNGSLI
ncbi:hypothetical protein C4K68_18110, partial [Pokkaliibacter plantistimulans]